jgi:hypothetical protein
MLRPRLKRPRYHATEQIDELTSSARPEQRRRNFEAERLGGLEVSLGWLLHRQVSRLLA